MAYTVPLEIVIWGIAYFWAYHINHYQLISQSLSGWWFTYPSEKYDFVSWDYCSQYMESHKSHLTNHQPVVPLVI